MGSKKGISEVEREFHAEISRRVEELRVRHKLQRIELAKIVGVTVQLLYAYEVGVTRWPAFRVRRIADFFEVKLEKLMPKSKQDIVFSALQRKLL